MASWAERLEQARLRGEQAKLWSLKFLCEPANVPHGEILPRICAAIHDTGAEIQSYDLRNLLKGMVADGLIEVGTSHPRHGNIRKPYRITNKGRDYLAEAESKAPAPQTNLPDAGRFRR